METTELTITILQHIRTDIARLGGRFDNLEKRFDTLEGRFDNLEKRFDTLEGRFDNLEKRFDNLEKRFDTLEGRFDTLEGRFDNLEGRFGILEAEVAAMRKDVKACLTRDQFRGAVIMANARFESLETRVTEIDVRNRTSNQELQDTLHQLMAHLGQHGSLAARIDGCERDIIDIKERVF